MPDTYKLQYDGMTLTYPGWNGYVSWEKSEFPIQRYEISLFKSSNGLGVSAGTVSMPFNEFEQIGVRCCWDGNRALHGSNWLWFNNQAFTATTGNNLLVFNIANDSNYFMFEANMNYNNTNKTFTVLNDQSTKWWGMTSPIGTNATLTGTNNGSRHKIVAEIVGVKYQ